MSLSAFSCSDQLKIVTMVGSSCNRRNIPGERTPEQRGFQDFYLSPCEKGYYRAQKPLLLEYKAHKPPHQTITTGLMCIFLTCCNIAESMNFPFSLFRGSSSHMMSTSNKWFIAHRKVKILLPEEKKLGRRGTISMSVCIKNTLSDNFYFMMNGNGGNLLCVRIIMMGNFFYYDMYTVDPWTVQFWAAWVHICVNYFSTYSWSFISSGFISANPTNHQLKIVFLTGGWEPRPPGS